MTDLIKQVAEIVELQKKATPGPWRWEDNVLESSEPHRKEFTAFGTRYSNEVIKGERKVHEADGLFLAAVGSLDFAALSEALAAPAPLLGVVPAESEDAITVYRGPADEADFVPPSLEMSDHAIEHWFGKDALSAAPPSTIGGGAGDAAKWQGAAMLALELEGWLNQAECTTTWTKHSEVLAEGLKKAIATIRENAA
jgi:hypothetical protein